MIKSTILTTILTTIFFIFSICFKAIAIDITSTGGWNVTITSANLISGAGSNLTSSYQSATNASLINISNCINNNDRWRVDLSRTNNIWNPILILSARRTTNGTSTGGSISGGTTYRQITTSAVTFFSGRGNRSNINVRYQLTGMSIAILPNTYSTSVIYTLVDI